MAGLNEHRPETGFSPDALAAALNEIQEISPDSHFAVAFSGGADSTALLIALSEWLSAREQSNKLRALHFDHAIHPDSECWRRHCQALCDSKEIKFDWHRHVGSRLVTEADARDARYHWLGNELAQNETLLTGHHQDDQVETVLMSLCQGRGLQRISGIPSCRKLLRNDRRMIVRPLLDFPCLALKEWLFANRVDWIDDPSNSNAEFDRNFVRLQVLPLLKERWPEVTENIARSARMIAGLSDNRAAEIDRLTSAISNPAATRLFCQVDPLIRAALSRMPTNIQTAILRHWILSVGIESPSDRQLLDFCGQLLNSEPSKRVGTEWKRVQIQAWKEHLYLLPILPAPKDVTIMANMAKENNPLSFGSVLIDWRPVPSNGIGLQKLQNAHTVWRMREGDECFVVPGRQHRNSLKKLLQSAAIPPWERNNIPLLEVDGEIAWVYGIGVSKIFLAGADSGVALLPQISLQKNLL